MLRDTDRKFLKANLDKFTTGELALLLFLARTIPDRVTAFDTAASYKEAKDDVQTFWREIHGIPTLPDAGQPEGKE